MRCGCRVCGEYMVQREQGEGSECICPWCFETCSACLGNFAGSRVPLDREGLQWVMRERLEEERGEWKEER
ncbi:MAG: hypothetical protein FWF10_08170 [Clostridiales bacterium]|nr:hypothetical protein [Clostridiales bacterium]